MLRLPKPKSSAAAILLAASLVACTDASEKGDDELDRYLCAQEDLSWEFHEQVAGSFSANDLGSLGDGTDERKAAYREAGLLRGRFVFWKESLPRPPFDPPLNVVCQVLVFESQAQAKAWVEGLVADSDEIAATGIVWLPGGERRVDEVAAGERPGRTFYIEADEREARVSLWATYEVHENLVLSVFAGDREGRLELEDVQAIQAARDARLLGD
jgi:hypothetical protein